MIRIGCGFDVHAFCAGRKLILGGVNIPSEFGLLGHSDADVLSHAVCDAVLGALALGDIGEHFPDTDPRYKNADSLQLLSEAAAKARAAGGRLINVDATVALESPRLSPHAAAMRKNLAAALSADPSQISVKATTCEGLGFVGRQEGAAAFAVVLMECGQ